MDNPGSLVLDQARQVWMVGRGCEAEGGAWVAHLDQDGALITERGFESGMIARFANAAVGLDREVWAAGFFSDFYAQPRGPNGTILYRFDESAVAPQTIRHEGFSYSGPDALLPLEDGSILVVQTAVSERGTPNSTGQNVSLLRFNQQLELISVFRSHSPGDDKARDAALTPDGNLWLAGDKWTGNPGTGHQAWAGLYDRDGNQRLERFFGTGSTRVSFDAVLATGDGGAWLAGSVGGYQQPIIIRIDATGEIVHELELDLPLPPRGTNPIALPFGTIRLMDLAYLPDGGILAVGHTSDPTNGELDALLVWLDSDGELLRVETFGTKGSDHTQAIQVLPDGSAIIAGATTNGLPVMDQGGWFGWVFRVGPNGELPALETSPRQ